MRHDFSCEIAGVFYHKSSLESGTFEGYIMPEPTNKVDKEAIGIYIGDGTLVGYIPQNEKRRFIIWGEGEQNLNCIIRLDIDEKYGRYYGVVEIQRNVETGSILEGKRVCITGDFSQYDLAGLKSFFKSYGAIIGNSKVSRKTDIVVYVESIGAEVIELSSNKEYHFKAYSLPAIIKELYENKPHNEFYGNVVSFGGSIGLQVIEWRDFLFFLLESGAIIEKYSKKSTDILIDSNKHPHQITEKAKEAGKEILFIEDILLKYWGIEEVSGEVDSVSKADDVINIDLSSYMAENETTKVANNYKWLILATVAVIIAVVIVLKKML